MEWQRWHALGSHHLYLPAFWFFRLRQCTGRASGYSGRLRQGGSCVAEGGGLPVDHFTNLEKSGENNEIMQEGGKPCVIGWQYI